jgi:hypothetical protein
MELLEQPMSTGDNFKNLVKTELGTSMSDEITQVRWEPFNDGDTWEAVHVTTGGRQIEINTAGNLYTRINVEKGDGNTANVYGTDFERVSVDAAAGTQLGEVAVCANGHVWMLGSGDNQGKVYFNKYDTPNSGEWFTLPDKETFAWITCGAEGTVWTVSAGGNVFYRDGVDVE